MMMEENDSEKSSSLKEEIPKSTQQDISIHDEFIDHNEDELEE